MEQILRLLPVILAAAQPIPELQQILPLLTQLGITTFPGLPADNHQPGRFPRSKYQGVVRRRSYYASGFSAPRAVRARRGFLDHRATV
jgi:hypothetical protein